jgi:hypothetical protein
MQHWPNANTLLAIGTPLNPAVRHPAADSMGSCHAAPRRHTETVQPVRQMKSIALLPFAGNSKLAAWTAIAVAAVIAVGVLHRTSVFGTAWDYVSSGKRRELPVRTP